MMKTHSAWRDVIRAKIQMRLRRIAEALFAGEYSLGLPTVLRTYTPWYESPMADIHREVSSHTTLTPERLYYLHRFAEYASLLPGEIAEVGSYRGGSGRILSKINGHKNVHLFDTFAGMPDNVECKRDGHSPGDFGDTSVELVRTYLSDCPNVKIHPGMVPETLIAVEHAKFALVHFDLDTYQGTLSSLEFFYNRIVPGGVLLFDEYALRAYKLAERRAVDEFFNNKPEVPIALSSGQGLVLKCPN